MPGSYLFNYESYCNGLMTDSGLVLQSYKKHNKYTCHLDLFLEQNRIFLLKNSFRYAIKQYSLRGKEGFCIRE